MTTEYHDNVEEESDSFWNKGPPVSLSLVSRFRPLLFPVLTATFILILIIALGASNTTMSNRLWSVESSVSNLTETQSSSQQETRDAVKDVQRVRFAVESNKDELNSVSEALKQLSALDSLSKTVSELKCSLEHLIHNSSSVEGCCPLEWTTFQSSCYLFSQTLLSWDEAKAWCNDHESHLAIILSDDEWVFVKSHSHGTYYWVGLTDGRTGQWEWVNHTPYVMNRRRWMPGQPDAFTLHGLGAGDEDCAHLHDDGRLNDLHCSMRIKSICQRHKGG
ncbi:hypothetical protein OYC64_001141 [Pagothenia borchgrevinki]|uniref:C-type lectin domain-containing protein n=1 Tax=Pagothenia borchgrevinki TaxID=8213 RepID=A0ABD2GBK8_PAGBO